MTVMNNKYGNDHKNMGYKRGYEHTVTDKQVIRSKSRIGHKSRIGQAENQQREIFQ